MWHILIRLIWFQSSQLILSLTFPNSVDMRRRRATQSEGKAVWVVRDLHNPWRKQKQTSQMSVCNVFIRVYVAVTVPSLFSLGCDQQPERAPYAKGLAYHGFNLWEWPEEQQVLIDGVDLPAHLQTSHLHGQTYRQETECCYLEHLSPKCQMRVSQVGTAFSPQITSHSDTSAVRCAWLSLRVIQVFTWRVWITQNQVAVRYIVPPRSITETNKQKHDRKSLSPAHIFFSQPVQSCHAFCRALIDFLWRECISRSTTWYD